jgi:hypothetical protein
MFVFPVWVQRQSFLPDGVAGLDALHVECVSKGVAISLEPADETRGNREMYLEGPTAIRSDLSAKGLERAVLTLCSPGAKAFLVFELRNGSRAERPT